MNRAFEDDSFKLGVHWRVELSRFDFSQMDTVPRVTVSRPARKWTQCYAALGESALRIRSGFEILRVLSCEQNNFFSFTKLLHTNYII